MMDYIEIGSTPAEERCSQVGEDDYPIKSRIETRAFINQLRRTFGEEPGSAYLTVKSFPHDFGSYREVVCKFDGSDDKAIEYCFNIENNSPARWDTLALDEIERELRRRD